LVDRLKLHQTNQRSESLRIQQEISIMKKEKLSLYQKVTDLQRKLNDMEITVGQDVNK